MRCFFLLLGYLFATLSWAATIDETRKTTGYGETYQQALSSTLLEAVRQIRGLEVGTEKVLKKSIIQSISATGYAIQGNEQVASDIYTKSKGAIKTYEVIETKKPARSGESWRVITLVTVPVYKENMKNDAHKTIAVLPFEIIPASIQFTYTLGNITERIADTITSELNQSQKFAVLNRSFEKQFDKKKSLLNSDKVSSTEASRLRRKLGADFIVTGKIYQSDFTKKTSNHYGMGGNEIEASMDLYYTVIEAATEKVMWSDTLTYKHTFRKSDNIADKFIAKLSSKIVTHILDVIYPVKIMKLAGQQNILLSQGGKRLKKGQIMEVYSAGESILDPDTGMKIRIDGRKVAELEITQVKPKYSIAKLLSDSDKYSSLSINAITRRAKTPTLNSGARSEQALALGSSDKPISW